MYCIALYLFFIEMMAGQISQIGWKSIEITLYACPVELGIISMDFHQIPPVEFDWALITGQIG